MRLVVVALLDAGAQLALHALNAAAVPAAAFRQGQGRWNGADTPREQPPAVENCCPHLQSVRQRPARASLYSVQRVRGSTRDAEGNAAGKAGAGRPWGHPAPRPSTLQGQRRFWRGRGQREQEAGLFPLGKPALPAATGIPSVLQPFMASLQPVTKTTAEQVYFFSKEYMHFQKLKLFI